VGAEGRRTRRRRRHSIRGVVNDRPGRRVRQRHRHRRAGGSRRRTEGRVRRHGRRSGKQSKGRNRTLCAHVHMPLAMIGFSNFTAVPVSLDCSPLACCCTACSRDWSHRMRKAPGSRAAAVAVESSALPSKAQRIPLVLPLAIWRAWARRRGRSVRSATSMTSTSSRYCWH